jgi:hypothetical protein
LPEVKVLGKRIGRLTGYKIVAAAIQKIDNNFPQQLFCYDAYYRDYQMIDNAYTNLNEAIVKVVDSGFQTVDQQETKIVLYEYKKNTDFARDTATEIAYDNTESKFVPNARLKPFGGNELTILRVHDPIRNSNALSFSFIYNFRNDFLKNHSFSIGNQIYLDNVRLYCVNFVSRSATTGTQHFAKGKIYVEHNNFAIHKIEYATYDKLENTLLYDIQLEYSRVADRMYLNYISFNNLFKIRDPRDFKVVDVVFDRAANTLSINVNNFPDPISAREADNYRFSVDDKKLKIEEVEIFPDNKKKIILLLGDNPHFNRWEHLLNFHHAFR